MNLEVLREVRSRAESLVRIAEALEIADTARTRPAWVEGVKRSHPELYQAYLEQAELLRFSLRAVPRAPKPKGD